MNVGGVRDRVEWRAAAMHPAGQGRTSVEQRRRDVMLWTVAVILWCCGRWSGHCVHGRRLVHVLLVIAAIVVVFQFLGAADRLTRTP